MSEWTKTEADALPWGEVVEVRWPKPNRILRCKPYNSGMSTMNFWQWADSHIYGLQGSEWRRLERGEADNGAS